MVDGTGRDPLNNEADDEANGPVPSWSSGRPARDYLEDFPEDLRDAVLAAAGAEPAFRPRSAAKLAAHPAWAGAELWQRQLAHWLMTTEAVAISSGRLRRYPLDGIGKAVSAVLGEMSRGRWFDPPAVPRSDSFPVVPPAAAPASTPWFLRRFVQAGRLVLFYARGEAGKGLVGLALAAAGAAAPDVPFLRPVGGGRVDGNPVVGRDPRKRPEGAKSPLWASWEESGDDVGHRIRMMANAGALPWSFGGGEPPAGAADRETAACADAARLAEQIDVVSRRDLSDAGAMWGPDPRGSGHTSTSGMLLDAGSRLFSMIRSAKYRLVVLDNLAHAFACDENNKALIAPFLAALDEAAEAGSCTVLMLAHPSLSGEPTESLEGGSRAWRNLVRNRLVLNRLPTGFKSVKGPVSAPVLLRDKANNAPSTADRVFLVRHWVDGAHGREQLGWFAATEVQAAAAASLPAGVDVDVRDRSAWPDFEPRSTGADPVAPADDRPMCGARCRDGRPCGNRAEAGAEMCGRHRSWTPPRGEGTGFDVSSL